METTTKINKTMETTDVVKIEKETVLIPSNLFGNKEVFEHAQRVATMLSKSDLVPKQFQGNIGNCIIALEMANRIGASPLMVMQNLYIVHGKPAWSSTFLIATVNACGKFSPLRYEEDNQDGGRVRAWALDKGNKEKVYGTWVSMKMAKAEGWIDKNGSKWQTMPDLMRRYRAATFFARQFAPEISMGIHTMEEVQEVPFVEINDTPALSDLKELYILKKGALTPDEITHADRIINAQEEKSYTKLYTLLKSK